MAPICRESGDKIKADVIVIAYPAQGHINPSLAMAKYLASNGLLVTFIVTTRVTKSAKISGCTAITIHTISDGSEEITQPETIPAFYRRFQSVLSANLAKFIDQHNTKTSAAKLIIYDSVMPWIQEIAHSRGLLAAPFFTQSAAVSAVFCHLKQGSLLRFPYKGDGVVSLPSLPPLETEDLPCYPALGDSEKIVVDKLALQFMNVEKADWIFCNTFHELESEILGWMENQWPIKTVGPTFLVRQDDNKNHSISIFESKDDACRELAFLVSVGKEQMEEVAFGLIRSSEVDKLPQDFASLSSGVMNKWSWVSHCGWNLKR